MKRLTRFFFVLFLLASCAPQTENPASTPRASTIDEAQATLIKFFDLLNSKQYTDADTLYGGDYEQLRIFSSDSDPSHHTKLWADACQLAGLQCLTVRTATFKNQQGATFIFQVEFNNPDGSLFVEGPCCGSNETEMPPVSQFEYQVVKNSNGKFLVMNLPPYVP